MSAAETNGTTDPDGTLLVPWAEVEVASVLSEMAAASARYGVVVTLTFVPPDRKPT